jgi:hypothetical protein
MDFKRVETVQAGMAGRELVVRGFEMSKSWEHSD